MRPGPQPARIVLHGVNRQRRVRAAVLVLNGASPAEVRRASSMARTLADSCLLVAVDGGVKACRAARRRPDLFVGDSDSASPPGGVPSVLFPADKDFSDLAGALDEARKRRVDVVVVAGLLGGRVDHEWANLFELGCGSHAFGAILAPSERGLVIVTGRGCRLETLRGRTASLFPLGGPATVTLGGTRWELARRRLRPGSRGLSNITGDVLELTVHSGTVALVFVSDGDPV